VPADSWIEGKEQNFLWLKTISQGFDDDRHRLGSFAGAWSPDYPFAVGILHCYNIFQVEYSNIMKNPLGIKGIFPIRLVLSPKLRLM
jgi:hypothetical protein